MKRSVPSRQISKQYARLFPLFVGSRTSANSLFSQVEFITHVIMCVTKLTCSVLYTIPQSSKLFASCALVQNIFCPIFSVLFCFNSAVDWTLIHSVSWSILYQLYSAGHGLLVTCLVDLPHFHALPCILVSDQPLFHSLPPLLDPDPPLFHPQPLALELS